MGNSALCIALVLRPTLSQALQPTTGCANFARSLPCASNTYVPR